MMNSLSTAIAQAVVKYRHLLQLSQEELADAAGIHRTYVSQIERGLKMPTIAILFKIAKALNVRASDLISEIESKYVEL